MKKTLFFLYGVVAYTAFMATILYAIGFVGNFIVPTTIDGIPQLPFWQALLINTGFLLAFAFQHSIMARPAFKEWWTRYVPVPVERSTFVLLASIILATMMTNWQPMGGVVWNIENELVQTVLFVFYLLGWAIVFLATFMINHFELFGLRQVWLHFRNQPYTHLRFRIPYLYKYVRHPLYLGFLIAFWSTPLMTVTHLLFAVATTGYILVAIQLEERDLITVHGQQYQDYRKQVPMILPLGTKQAPAVPADANA
ncbi:MAG: isoprenylcysteine carboxylmethyltransferase family protein [Bacteroidetes bacterium]|nr:MAG: isoprenylcysteine carboxylmethyltransferase family protein [Bacteroidota bacterium]